MLIHNHINDPIVQVAIGIQARSTSKRFPNKIHEAIGKKTILEHIVYSVERASFYLNKSRAKLKINVDASLLVPFKDSAVELMKDRLPIMEGPENDVLTRYVLLQKEKQYDYVVRLTGDCPLIPPFTISKLITLAVANRYDYVSNVDERCRTAPDGFDCEVISKKMLSYLDEHATTDFDREHVTTLARREPPAWGKMGAVVNFIDLSFLKLSVDTEEDLVRVKSEYDKVKNFFETAVDLFGHHHVHRF